MISSQFFHHFDIGPSKPFAVRLSTNGKQLAGWLLDCDDRGLYLDMEDGGTTFVAWPVVELAWDGDAATESIRQRDELRRLQQNGEGFGKILARMLGESQSEGESKPALSPEEIERVLAESREGKQP